MTAPANYVLKWSDEFTSPTLDRSKWTPTTAQIARGYGAETWAADHVQLVDGQLELRATADYLAGDVRSVPLFTPPLYVEFSARPPACGNGGWPAGWLLTPYSNSGSFSRQEIDILEDTSALPRRVGENLHWGTRAVPGGLNGQYVDPLIDYQAAFHTYGVLYTTLAVDFYVDEVLRRPYAQPAPPNLFDPMQIRFSLSIYGPAQASWAVLPDVNTLWPMIFRVAWVRVWQPGHPPKKHHGKAA